MMNIIESTFILKAAKCLEELGLPKKTICAELVQHIRFASERLIYKTLTPEYKRDYDDDNNESALGADVDDNKDIEKDAEKVALSRIKKPLTPKTK